MSLKTNIKKYKEIKGADKPKLIISKQVCADINKLHETVDNIEWSGILFFKVLEGSIESPSEMVMRADYIYPMDIGTSGWTEFNYGSEYLEAFDLLPLIEDDVVVYKPALVHSHHAMEAFFSGTDWETLHEQAPNNNYFLSLIVNYKCKPVAKIAMFGQSQPSAVVFKGTHGEIKVDAPGEDVLMIYDCNIEWENEEWFTKRVEVLKQKAQNKKTLFSKPMDTIGFKPPKQGTLFATPKLSVTEEQLKRIIVQSISGDVTDESNLFTALKTCQSDFKKMGPTWEEEIYETISDNFDEVVQTVLDLEHTTWEDLDVVATKCHKLLQQYNFDKQYTVVVRAICDSLTYFFDESYQVQ